MSVDAHPTTQRSTADAPARRRVPVVRVIAGSLAAGVATALILTLVVFPGATESVITGSILTAFGLGWAMHGRAVRAIRRPAPTLDRRPRGLPGRLRSRAAGLLPAERHVDRTQLGMAADHARTRGLDVHADAPQPARNGSLAAHPRRARPRRHDHRRHRRERRRGPSPPVLPDPRRSSTTSVATGCTSTARARADRPCVLFNGLGEISATWARIIDQVSHTTRVCAYDRAGQGWSDDADGPQDGVTAAKDLHTLLAAAGEHGLTSWSGTPPAVPTH